MNKKIKKIFLSSEIQDTFSKSQISDSPIGTDVIVKFRSGEEYTASFFDYKKLPRAFEQKNRMEYNSNFVDNYFWTPNMLLTDNCSRKNIESIIKTLIEEGEFWKVFEKV